MKLTDRQSDIFEFICTKIMEGLPPTYREIAEKFSICVRGARDHVKAIEKKGYIRIVPKKSRGIFLI